VRSGRIKRVLALGIAGALAMDAASPLYAQLRPTGESMEHMGSNHPTRPDTFLGFGARPGNTTVTPVTSTFSSPNQAARGRRSGAAYTMRGLDVALNQNKGPDDYFAPRYRDGKCVEDEGNTLVTGPTLGGGVRRMQGKSLERALATLCRKAAL
jgi:hypothetical protein